MQVSPFVFFVCEISGIVEVKGAEVRLVSAVWVHLLEAVERLVSSLGLSRFGCRCRSGWDSSRVVLVKYDAPVGRFEFLI